MPTSFNNFASKTFSMELDRWGPNATGEPISTQAAEAYCKQLATTHYENFSVVSWFLPHHLRQPFFNVYAFCRWSDDLGDEVGDRQTSRELLAWWRQELEACWRGEARHPVFIALRPTVEQFQLDIEPFHNLISAFEQDQQLLEYETFADLLEYCGKSAAPVGRIVLRLWQQHTSENLAWSDSVCIGLQLANFWQDVSRDLDIHRIYLPLEDRVRFGVTRDDLLQRQTTPAMQQLLAFEVDRARHYLNAGWEGVSRMPASLRFDLTLFISGGLRILDKIEAARFRVLEQRPRLTKWDHFQLFTRALWGRTGQPSLTAGAAT